MAVGAAAAGTQSEPIGYAIEKEHAIGAHRLRERERARKRSRSAPFITSHEARSGIFNDKKGANAKINFTTITQNTVSNVIKICSPLRAGLCERTLKNKIRLQFEVFIDWIVF
ncbi:unnamed protein product [Parnassius apollo]|uniref:(apollo) hypothetical protein n=1 Tax=Parnassius apollo TaxID=110799 RepID=A0A8S3X006_PARAO|nr:unnamed protein product [Parnassius apollo]